MISDVAQSVHSCRVMQISW